MNFLQEISSLSSPQNVEKVADECCCDKPRKPKKTIEEIAADKQLKELFKKEMKKDIFKLCRDYGDRYWRTGLKIPDKPEVKKKRHFLPPLKKKHVDSRFIQTDSYYEIDLSKLETEYSFEEEEREEVEEGEEEFDDDDDDYYRRKLRGRYKGKGKGDGKDGAGDRFGDGGKGRGMSDDMGKDKGGDKGKGKGGRHRGGRKSKDSRASGSGKVKLDGSQAGSLSLGSKKGGSQATSSSELSSGLELSLLGFGEGGSSYEDGEGYLQIGGYWDKRSSYLMKYYQLKKMAAKLESRALEGLVKSAKKTARKGLRKSGRKSADISDREGFRKSTDEIDKAADKTETKDVGTGTDFEKGYKYGYEQGVKKALTVPPVYENKQHKDFLDDDSESEVFQSEDSSYDIGAGPKTKVVYISTDQQQIDELKRVYKGVELRSVPDRRFASKTGQVIRERIEECLLSYKQVLLDKTGEYIEGFNEGFKDGFYQTFIFEPTDESFENDEKFYVNEVRKCVLEDQDSDDSLVTKALLDRAQDLKEAFKDIIDFDAYEKEIESLNLTKSLQFTKSDFIFFYGYRKQKKKPPMRGFGRKQPKSKHRGKFLDFDSSSTESFEKHARRKVRTDERAWDYLNKHNIGELFRYMGIMLCSYKPDDPIDFLIKLLDKCLLFRSNEARNKAPLVFTEKHVESLYSNMDPLNYGHIDGKQYLYGLNLLEITEPDDITLVQNTDTVEKNQFLINANDRLLEKFRVMIAIC